MSALEKAKKVAEERLEEQLQKQQKEKNSAKIKESNKNYFLETINRVVSEFDGVNGIEVVKNAQTWTLFKGKGKVKEEIVRVEFGYGQWENPNYDYRVDEEGYIAKIESWPGTGHTYERWQTSKVKGEATECHHAYYFEDIFAGFI